MVWQKKLTVVLLTLPLASLFLLWETPLAKAESFGADIGYMLVNSTSEPTASSGNRLITVAVKQTEKDEIKVSTVKVIDSPKDEPPVSFDNFGVIHSFGRAGELVLIGDGKIANLTWRARRLCGPAFFAGVPETPPLTAALALWDITKPFPVARLTQTDPVTGKSPPVPQDCLVQIYNQPGVEFAGENLSDSLGQHIRKTMDFNGDGQNELLFSFVRNDPASEATPPDREQVLIAVSTDTFTPLFKTTIPVKGGSNNFATTATGTASDINRDGYLEFLLGFPKHQVSVADTLGNGAGLGANGGALTRVGRVEVRSGKDGTLLYSKTGAEIGDGVADLALGLPRSFGTSLGSLGKSVFIADGERRNLNADATETKSLGRVYLAEITADGIEIHKVAKGNSKAFAMGPFDAQADFGEKAIVVHDVNGNGCDEVLVSENVKEIDRSGTVLAEGELRLIDGCIGDGAPPLKPQPAEELCKISAKEQSGSEDAEILLGRSLAALSNKVIAAGSLVGIPGKDITGVKVQFFQYQNKEGQGECLRLNAISPTDIPEAVDNSTFAGGLSSVSSSHIKSTPAP